MLVILFIFTLALIAIVLTVCMFTANSVEGNPMVPIAYKPASKRCKQCQIHPKPTDMVLFFGPNWDVLDTCSECRAKNIANATKILEKDAPLKAYLALCPKLAGLEPRQIKEWYVAKQVRKAARDKSYSYDYRKKYEIFFTDGRRFWKYRDFPHLMTDYMTCEKFKEDYPSWEVIVPEGTQGNAFAYIKC